MSEVSKIKVRGTVYSFKDAVARGEEEEAEGISCFKLGGEVYDYKDIVARGEGDAEAKEISKVSVGGKVYQIKDEEARESVPVYDNYFAVYSADDRSLTFYGDNEIPTEGEQYRGKTVTNIYTDVENTGTSNPPWYSLRDDIKITNIHSSFGGARPTSCYRWFYEFYSSTAITGLGNLNTSEVTTMHRMFANANGLTELDVSNFDTSKVTDMGEMFFTCMSLTELDVSNFDTSKVTDMRAMFDYCTKLTTLDVSNFDTSKVTDMEGMFSDCMNLTALDVSNFDTSKVTDIACMFYYCTSLAAIDVSGFDTSNVTDMYRMFYHCTSLTTIYSDDAKFVTTKVTSSEYMFQDSTALVGGNGTTYDSDKLDHTMAHVDTAGNPGYFTGGKS